MASYTHGKQSISLSELETRFVEPTIIRKMVSGFFARASNPLPAADEHVLTISCVDSRVPPAKILGLEHGQAFSIQTVANVVPELNPNKTFDEQSIEVAAGLQYAIEGKGVNRILVMGHTDCGGAEARIVQNASLPNVNRWMNHVCLPGVCDTPDAGLIATMMKDRHPFFYKAAREAAEKECLATSVRNIRDMPFVREAIEKASLSLASMTCDIREGRLNIAYSNRSASPAIADVLERFRTIKSEAWGSEGYMHDLAANGQHPKSLIVTGISPYVAPETVFGIEPGDSFIHRRLGGQYHRDPTPNGLDATIEFAVKAKGVPSLIFVGHRNDVYKDYALGEIDHLDVARGFIEKCIPDIRQWRDSGMDPDKMHEKRMKASFFNAHKHEAVQDAVHAGKLTVAALLVDHEHGTMEYYNPQTDEFMVVTPPNP